MSFLSSPMRGALKRSLNRWLHERFSLTVDAVTIGADGGQTRAEAPVSAAVPGRKIRASQADMASAGLVGEQETMKDTYKLIATQGTAFAVDQHVKFDGDTQEYDVIGVVSELTDDLFESAIITRRR